MPNRYANLDGLRGIAALIVVSLHCIIAFDPALYSGLPADSHGQWDITISGLPFLLPLAGDYSVCIFFALSGFVLAHSFSRTRLDAPALAVKRYVRLGLPILAACLFSWALLANGLMFNHAAAETTESSWLDSHMRQAPSLPMAFHEGTYGSLLALPNARTYDPVLWTMGIEFMGSILMIAIFALLRRLGDRRGIRGLPGATFLMLGLLGYGFFLGLFAFGAAMYHVNLRARLERIPRLHLVMLPVLILGIFLGTVPYSAARGSFLDTLVSYAFVSDQSAWQFAYPAWLGLDGESFWHAVGALLTLLAADAWGPLRRLLSHPLSQFLGRISFPLYLVHLPILFSAGCGIFLLCLSIKIGFAAAVVLSVAVFVLIAILIAWMSTLLIETRAVTWSNAAAVYVQRAMRSAVAFLRKADEPETS
jgi:peptidoglycan/LPS O-acetylase OafA/YrhL